MTMRSYILHSVTCRLKLGLRATAILDTLKEGRHYDIDIVPFQDSVMKHK